MIVSLITSLFEKSFVVFMHVVVRVTPSKGKNRNADCFVE